MRRGPKPKPDALKLLEGCRADRINGSAPTFPPATAEPPDWLWGFALEHWNELAPYLISRGLLTVADRPALALLCDEFRRTRDDPGDDKARNRHMALLKEFGLTPASRIRVPSAPPVDPDALSVFLSASPKIERRS